MRAILVLLLILAAIVFVSFYGTSLRPYWEDRLPRVATHLSDGEFREAASAMVDEAEDTPPSTMVVATSPSEPAEPDTSCEASGLSATRAE